MYFAYLTCTTKLRISSWTLSVLRVLFFYYKVANFELELWKCTSRTRVVLQSCDFPAGAAEVYFAIFELELRKCTSRTRLARQSCDARAGATEVYFVY